ncbi:hypothetical protein CR513_12943, partial [Mucuna pruriens]
MLLFMKHNRSLLALHSRGRVIYKSNLSLSHYLFLLRMFNERGRLILWKAIPKAQETHSSSITSPIVSIHENPIGEVIDYMLEVSIPENPIEDVTDVMPISLRKGKQSCVKYPISQFSFIIVATNTIKTPTSIQEVLKDEN